MSILSLTERHSLHLLLLTMPSVRGWFLDLLWGQLDSNPAPLLRILASSVRRWQSWCALCGASHCPFHMPHRHTASPAGRVAVSFTLVHLVGSVSIAFLSHAAPGFQSPPCAWTVRRTLLLSLPWRPWACPQGMLGVEVTRLPGLQGP